MTRRGYLLTVLVALSTLNQLDRQLMAILLEPIREEFALSDIQLGVLSGFAFAMLYAALSVPAALWAVRHNRRNLVALAATVWGVMTLLSGFAQSFWQLLLGRLGIGAGEAGAMPASHAVISDLYGPHERAGAMSLWSCGVNLGVFIAFLLGGYIGHRFGWRAAFIAAGCATLTVAALIRLTVHEPAREQDARSENLRRAPSLIVLRETATLMWRDVVLRHIVAGATVTAIVGYGAVTWIPSYLVRFHDLTIATAGLYLALVIGLGGALASALGGRLADHLGQCDIRWPLWFVGVAFLLTKPLSITFYLTGDTAIALLAFLLPGLLGTFYLGPAIAILHDRVPSALRPSASAFFLLMVNIVGLGIGPLAVGMLSQWLFFTHGAGSLGYALAVMQIAGAWGAAHFLIAGWRMTAATPFRQTAIQPD